MKFNIGCGKRNFGSDWIHIDAENFSHINSDDIFLSTFEKDSATLIYASHFIEYFDRDEVLEILFSWKKVLKKNGVLRLAVPDFKSIATLYVNGLYPLENFLGPLYGKMKMKNRTIYHKTVYDFHNIKVLLKKIGMKDISIYNWELTEHSNFDDHSQAYLPHMDKKDGTLISLNIECKK